MFRTLAFTLRAPDPGAVLRCALRLRLLLLLLPSPSAFVVYARLRILNATMHSASLPYLPHTTCTQQVGDQSDGGY